MKVDITVSRLEKINTHDIHPFTFVEPGVTITLKDIDIKNVEKATELATDYVNNAMVLEIAKAVNQITGINKITPAVFTEAIVTGRSEKYEAEIKRIAKEITELE